MDDLGRWVTDVSELLREYIQPAEDTGEEAYYGDDVKTMSYLERILYSPCELCVRVSVL